MNYFLGLLIVFCLALYGMLNIRIAFSAALKTRKVLREVNSNREGGHTVTDLARLGQRAYGLSGEIIREAKTGLDLINIYGNVKHWLEARELEKELEEVQQSATHE